MMYPTSLQLLPVKQEKFPVLANISADFGGSGDSAAHSSRVPRPISTGPIFLDSPTNCLKMPSLQLAYFAKLIPELVFEQS